MQQSLAFKGYIWNYQISWPPEIQAIVRFEQTIFEIYHSDKSKVSGTAIQMTTKESTKSHSEI